MTSGTEGLPSDPVLGVLLLILLCKRNGVWDPAPAGGESFAPRSEGTRRHVCPQPSVPGAGLPSLLNVGSSGGREESNAKEQCQGWQGTKAALGPRQPTPLLLGGLPRGTEHHWGQPGGNSVSLYPVIVDLINAGPYSLAENRSARADTEITSWGKAGCTCLSHSSDLAKL